MPKTQTSYASLLELNGEPVIRTYTAEIKNVVAKGKKVNCKLPIIRTA
ncbi:hypothetical protein [Zobellia galactanivorans]|uniref:Uncharacterized protein n=1 Tax=Zobellia galactanivorans (strain DSM 12802 / CCUG 47099 / CIP 106680 / NCIMB 13871 / Dsij) TaxID=63186 RepID=G0L0V9_ZOBGA|nr:hypothetical protein [Zobellia galactanivorans]CAZ94496.1 Putative protein [Zobellia galactanivorans]